MGRFVPLQSFHLTVSTTKHNVGDLRGGNGIPAHVAMMFKNSGSVLPFLPFDSQGEG